MLIKWLKDESGQGMVEYAMIISAVALAAAGGFTLLGINVSAFFSGHPIKSVALMIGSIMSII